MAPYTRFIAVSALLALGIAQSCPAPPSYSPLPEFPPNKCIDNYDFELTLGKVSIEKARQECQEECTASESDCSSYVIEVRDVTKCLLFKEGNSAQPTPCHDVCKLEGYTKGTDILPCLSASPVVATSYCNSLLTNTVTTTATITPGASTRISNFTLTATRNQTAVLTRTVDSTTTLTTTTTLFTSPTVTTNIIVLPGSTTLTVTATATSTSTLTNTVTVTAIAKRALARQAAIAPPACVPWDTPLTKLSSACSAYNAAPSTVTRTATLGATFVTKINNQTVTLTNPVTIYETTTVIASATATEPTTISVPQTAITTTTSIETAFATTTTTTTVSTTATATKTVVPFRPCGLPENYRPSAIASGTISCTPVAAPSANVYFRIEAENNTPFEGCIITGPKSITTPSGGTHQCGRSDSPSCSTVLDDAAIRNGFTYDGSWSPSFNDYFITRIDRTQQSGNSYWGVLNNGVFTTSGGCQAQIRNGDNPAWFWDAFNKQGGLSVTPQWATVTPGTTVTLTFTQRSLNGGGSSPAAGVSINGQTTDSNGVVVITAPQSTGCYQFKGEKDRYTRSNYFSLNVFDSFN